MTEYLNVSLQEEVPEHILRTEDDFSSDTGESSDEQRSEASYEGEDMVIDHGEEFETEENTKWANAMAQVLKSDAPKGKSSIVLAKAKKLTDISKKAPAPKLDFEIVGEEDKPVPAPIKEEITGKERKSGPKINRTEWRLKGRVKPSILEKNREKTLAKISVKGIVQLFNTVREHQKKINKQLNEAGSFRKKEKILQSVDKRAFLDMLMGPTASKHETSESVKPEIKEEGQVSWKVLRDDFMMGGNLKDWDKKLEDPNLSTEVNDQEKKANSDSDGESVEQNSDNDPDDSEDENSTDG